MGTAQLWVRLRYEIIVVYRYLPVPVLKITPSPCCPVRYVTSVLRGSRALLCKSGFWIDPVPYRTYSVRTYKQIFCCGFVTKFYLPFFIFEISLAYNIQHFFRLPNIVGTVPSKIGKNKVVNFVFVMPRHFSWLELLSHLCVPYDREGRSRPGCEQHSW